MPFVCPNLVFETTTVTGTGPATLLGPEGDFLDFDSQLANGDTVPYTIEHAGEKEVGIGTFSTSGPTLTRTTILFSTNGGAAVNFGAGTKNVYSGLPGELVSSLVEHGAADGILAQTAARTYARRTITAGDGLVVTDGDGVAGDPTIATTFRRIEEFGAVEGVGFASTNNTAFADAVTWLALQTEPAAIVFSAGIWEYSTSPNWAHDYAQILGHGTVRLRYTGTGNAFILDGGAAGIGNFDMKVGPFIIEAPNTAQDGVYLRSVHHSKLDFNVRGCGTNYAGMRILWGVVNDIRLIVSVNEGGWYLSAKPKYGLYLHTRGGADATAYNTFVNPILEGCQIGCEIDDAIGNQFFAGTMEGCTTVGLNLVTLDKTNSNKFYGVDYELNGAAGAGPDIWVNGFGNEFIGVDTFSELIIQADAKNTIIRGGGHRDITIDAGARTTIINGITIDRFGNIPAGVITDNGTDSIIRDIIDNAGNYTLVRGITKNPTTLPAKQTITVGASPFQYVNTSDVSQNVCVSPDQNITRVTYGRITSGENISLTHGMWVLMPGDQLVVEYPDPTGPSMFSWDFPR